MTDEELEKAIIHCFDVFGQAVFLTIKAAHESIGQRPSENRLTAARQRWRNLGKEIIAIGKELN